MTIELLSIFCLRHGCGKIYEKIGGSEALKLTTRSRLLLTSWDIQKISRLYGTRISITEFMTARHWSSYSDESNSHHHIQIIYDHFNNTLPFILDLSSDLSHSSFRSKILYVFLHLPHAPGHVILLSFISLITFCEEYRIPAIMQFLQGWEFMSL
jgi:hypothetical protein